MPSLPALLPLALLPAVALPAPLAPQSSAVRVSGRSPVFARGNLALEQHIGRDLAGFAGKLQNVEDAVLVDAGKMLKKRSTRITLANQRSNGWLQTHAGDIKVGTPAQTLPVLFDTGSYDLMLPAECIDGCPNGFFDTSASSSFVNLNTTAQIAFASGGVASGYAAQDRVSVGSYMLDDQHFLAATSFQHAPTNYAGIMGLAPYGRSAVGGSSFFDRLTNSFSTWFSRGAQSELVLDGVDASKYTGTFTTVPVIPGGGYWLVYTAGYSWQKQPLDASSTVTLVDSGSAYNYIPRSAAAALAQKLNGTRIQTLQRTFLGQTADVDIYSVPCNTVSYVGLGLTFVGSSSSAPLVMNAADNISERETIGGTTTCYGSFFGIDLLYNGVPASILGLPFLESFYTTWSYGASGKSLSLSFATAKRR